MTFDAYIGIDYSGAKTPDARLSGLEVYLADDELPERVNAPFGASDKRQNWTRREIAEWLIDRVSAGSRCVIGIDHGFSFPMTYLRGYTLTTWDEFLNDFVEHWPTHRPDVTVDMIRKQSNGRTGSSRDLRLCEQWTSSAKSVFLFDVQGQVAKSTHSGIPWLWHIRNEVGDRVHFWPFDGWNLPEDRSVIAEVYPSIFRSRYRQEGPTDHELDAYSVARWLKETCESGFLERYIDPPLTEEEQGIASLEGWILGIA